MDKLLYTKREAARLLSISEDTLDDLRRSGKLRTHRTVSGKPQFTHDCPILMMYFGIRNHWKCRFPISRSTSITGMI